VQDALASCMTGLLKAMVNGATGSTATRAPRNVRGTTPGKTWWSYCVPTRWVRLCMGIELVGSELRGCRPDLRQIPAVVEEVVHGLLVEALLHLHRSPSHTHTTLPSSSRCPYRAGRRLWWACLGVGAEQRQDAHAQQRQQLKPAQPAPRPALGVGLLLSCGGRCHLAAAGSICGCHRCCRRLEWMNAPHPHTHTDTDIL
jgi:hypothetical protein